MSYWNKISLHKFQQIDEINASDMEPIDKALFSACIVFDMTDEQMNNSGITKATKLVKKTEQIFSTTFQPCRVKRISRYMMNYDPATLTFGQFIELSFYMQSHIEFAHYCLASISKTRFGKYNTQKHHQRAEHFLHQPVEKIMGSLLFFMDRFSSFIKEYKHLFGVDKEVAGQEAPADPFNKRYGWIYSASQVAEYERITLNEAFGLPVRQAFNDLSYLKARAKYDAEQQKRMSDEIKNNRNGR